MDSIRPVYIYVLIDPRTDEVRYVGKTEYPEMRRKDHVRLVKLGHDHSYKASWIKQLLAEGLAPIFKIVKDTDADNWVQVERTIIRVLRANGVRLTNLSNGGEGGDPTPMQRGQREKFKDACIRGHAWTTETTVLVSDPDGGTHKTCRACKKMRSNAYYRRKHPEQTSVPFCRHGHERTPENTIRRQEGNRIVTRCRPCTTILQKRMKRQKREREGTCYNHLHPVCPENGFWTVTKDGRRSYHCVLCAKGRSGRHVMKKFKGQLPLPL